MKLFYNNNKYSFNNIGLYILNEEETVDQEEMINQFKDSSSDTNKLLDDMLDSSDEESTQKEDNQKQFNNEIEKLNNLSSTIQQLMLGN